MTQLVLNTPIGKVGFLIVNQRITEVDLYSQQSVGEPFDAFSEKVMNQVNEYFKGSRTCFDLPIRVVGTDFRKSVWNALMTIPYGSTRTYGELAKDMASSARAIGGACRHNPIPLIVPCHRIVAASGIGGFSGEITGDFVNTKQWLLNWESQAQCQS